MNRGSALHPRRPNRPSAGFNEAPIHESGKLPPFSRSRPEDHGFNEAPIHESGK